MYMYRVHHVEFQALYHTSFIGYNIGMYVDAELQLYRRKLLTRQMSSLLYQLVPTIYQYLVEQRTTRGSVILLNLNLDYNLSEHKRPIIKSVYNGVLMWVI